jgi:hypothetical protein
MGKRLYVIIGGSAGDNKVHCDKESDVLDKFGIGRSMRRGATAHARNMEVSEELIKVVHRWMNRDKGTSRLDMMIELYLNADALAPT